MLAFSDFILFFFSFSGTDWNVITDSIHFLLHGSRTHLIKCKVISQMGPKCKLLEEKKKSKKKKTSLARVWQVFVLVWQVFGVEFVTRGDARCRRSNVFVRSQPFSLGKCCRAVCVHIQRPWKDVFQEFFRALSASPALPWCPWVAVSGQAWCAD